MHYLLNLATVIAISLGLLLIGCSGAAEKHFQVGSELQDEGRFIEAIAEYDEALRLDPDYINAHSNRGLAYYNLGQHERAIQDFDEALRLDPNFAKAY